MAVCAPFNSAGAKLTTSQAQTLSSTYDTFASCTIPLAAGQILMAGTTLEGGRTSDETTWFFLFASGMSSFSTYGYSYTPYGWSLVSFVAPTSGSYTLLQGCSQAVSCYGTVAYTISLLPPPPSPPPLSAPHSSPPPSSSPPPPPTAISAALTIDGCTLATFGTAQLTVFKAVVGDALKVNASAVYITAIAAATAPGSGRHRSLLVASGVNVAFTALVMGAAPPTSASAAASLGAINAATLQSGGLTACTGIAVSVAPSLATPAAVAPPPADVISTLPVTLAPLPPPASVTASAPARAASSGAAALCAASSLIAMLF